MQIHKCVNTSRQPASEVVQLIFTFRIFTRGNQMTDPLIKIVKLVKQVFGI